MGIGTDLLDVLDGEVVKRIGEENAEDSLISLYVDVWASLKQRAGTSSGFGGVGEYLFLRYVLNYIERRYRIMLAVERCTLDTCVFRSDSLLLTHDVDISTHDRNCPKQKPDIALFIRTEDTWRLAAAFEIKTSVSGPKDIEKMLCRFDSLLANTSSLVFPVPFNAGDRITTMYKKEFDDFCDRSGDRAFVISKAQANYKVKIGLNAAIDKSLKGIST